MAMLAIEEAARPATMLAIEAPPIRLNPDGTPALSKRKEKKRARLEAKEAAKPQRRKEERQRRKQNAAARKAAGEPVTKKRKIKNNERTVWNARVILELAWDDKMSDKEIISMTRQIYDCYNQTRICKQPIPIECVAFNSRCQERMDGPLHGSHNLWSSDLISFNAEGLPSMLDKGIRQRENIVYLTADSENILTTLEKGKTYVIGGIVDRNRYKSLCLDHANNLGVAHAQLPIGQYIQNMSTRKILTVNQVYQILLEWVATQDWEKAFYAAIPQRKFDKPVNAKGLPQESEDGAPEETAQPIEIDGAKGDEYLPEIEV